MFARIKEYRTECPNDLTGSRFELETFCVLDRCDNHLHHPIGDTDFITALSTLPHAILETIVVTWPVVYDIRFPYGKRIGDVIWSISGIDPETFSLALSQLSYPGLLKTIN